MGNHLWFNSRDPDKQFRSLTFGVLLVAFALRLLFVAEYPAQPYSQLHAVPQTDMSFFYAWGQRIAAGDWLTASSFHPFGSWHAFLAQAAGAESDTAARALWDAWYGGVQYHQEPLYPLLLGVMFKVAGANPYPVYILQVGIGLLSVWLIMVIGQRYFGNIAGLVAGLLYAAYGPALFLEGMLLRETLLTCAQLGIVALGLDLVAGRGRPLVFGLLGGLAFLTKSTTLLVFAIIFAAWLLRMPSQRRQQGLALLAFLMVGAILVARNGYVGAPLLSSSSVAAITFAATNVPDYEPYAGFVLVPDVGRVMAAAGGSMFHVIGPIIELHQGVLHWAALCIQKFAAIFHHREILNNTNFHLAREFGSSLPLAGVTFSVIGPLGLVGMLLALWRRSAQMLVLVALAQLSLLVLFYVTSRFRVPMVSIWVIFAGFAVQEILRGPTWRERLPPIALALILVVVHLRPLPAEYPVIRSDDWAMVFQTFYSPALHQAISANQPRAAHDLLAGLLAAMPARFARIAEHGETADLVKEDRDTAQFFSFRCTEMAKVYRAQSAWQDAKKWNAAASRLAAAAQP